MREKEEPAPRDTVTLEEREAAVNRSRRILVDQVMNPAELYPQQVIVAAAALYLGWAMSES